MRGTRSRKWPTNWGALAPHMPPSSLTRRGRRCSRRRRYARFSRRTTSIFFSHRTLVKLAPPTTKTDPDRRKRGGKNVDKFTALTMDDGGRFYTSVFEEENEVEAGAVARGACLRCGHTLVCVFRGVAEPMHPIDGDDSRNDERCLDTSGFSAYLVGGAIGAACLLLVGLLVNEQDAVSTSIGMMLSFVATSVAYRASLKPT